MQTRCVGFNDKQFAILIGHNVQVGFKIEYEQCFAVQRRLIRNDPGVFAGTEKTTSTVPVDEVDLEVATLERAALEMMYLVPKRQSYEEAFQAMESLTSLRPQVVQQLLVCCTSVKTKRLFMHAAERANHAWLKHLDLSKVDFGSGRRTIHAGGHLDKKYDLVVADPAQG